MISSLGFIMSDRITFSRPYLDRSNCAHAIPNWPSPPEMITIRNPVVIQSRLQSQGCAVLAARQLNEHNQMDQQFSYLKRHTKNICRSVCAQTKRDETSPLGVIVWRTSRSWKEGKRVRWHFYFIFFLFLKTCRLVGVEDVCVIFSASFLHVSENCHKILRENRCRVGSWFEKGIEEIYSAKKIIKAFHLVFFDKSN